MSFRGILRYAAVAITSAFLTLVLVVPALNVERLAEERRWDMILVDLLSGDPAGLWSWAYSLEARIITACLAAFTLGLLIDSVLRRLEGRPSRHDRLAVRASLISRQIKEVTRNMFLYSDQINSLSSEVVSLMMDFNKLGYPTPMVKDDQDQVEVLKIVSHYLDIIGPLIRNGKITEAKQIAGSITG